MDKVDAGIELSLNGSTEGVLRIRLSGNWKIEKDLSFYDEIQNMLTSEIKIHRLVFDSTELTRWDSSLPVLILKIKGLCSKKKIFLDSDGLPEGVKRLLKLATAVPKKKDIISVKEPETFVSLVGAEAIHFFNSAREMIAFIGEVFLAFIKFLSGKARYRRSDFTMIIQQCQAS